MPSKRFFLPGALGRMDEHPALLLWGDADPISPVRIGQQLAAHLRRSDLHVVEGADHDLACTHAALAAARIDRHPGASNQFLQPGPGRPSAGPPSCQIRIPHEPDALDEDRPLVVTGFVLRKAVRATASMLPRSRAS